MNSQLKNAAPQLLFGLCVLLLGCLLLLENLGYIRIHLWDFWPAIFVFIGVGRIIQADTVAGRLIGLVFVAAGGLWIMYNLSLVDVSPWDFWPVGLILLGGLLIWRTIGFDSPGPKPGEPAEQASDDFRMVAILGGFKRALKTKDFRRGALTAFMGGCEVDMRDASISSGVAVVDVFAFWGGIDITIPEDWTVETRAVPILGGIECKARTPENDSKRLVVKGMLVMGGMEIKN